MTFDESVADELTKAGQTLSVARAQLEYAMSNAQYAAIRAVNAGVSESTAAKTLGVDRMTVRKWMGK
jgi:DNA-binding transcriptional regulator YiaG